MDEQEIKTEKKELKFLTIESVSNVFIITSGYPRGCSMPSEDERAVVNSIGELVIYLSENYK